MTDNVTYLHEYKWYVIFFIAWDNINTEESVEVYAKDKEHAERIFKSHHLPFYEPLYIPDVLIVEATDYLD